MDRYETMSISGDLTIESAGKYKDHLNWLIISSRNDLTTELFDRFSDYIHWDFLPYDCPDIITNDFINKYSNKVNWNYVSMYANLTESFIKKHKHKIKWEETEVSTRIKVSFEVAKELLDYLDVKNFVEKNKFFNQYTKEQQQYFKDIIQVEKILA